MIFNACTKRKTTNAFKSGSRVPAITILTTTEEYDSARYQAAYYIASWWREIGLEVKVEPLDFNMLTSTVRDNKPQDKYWHAFLYGWTGRVERADPDMFLYSITHSSQAGGVGNNYSEYKNPDYDALAEAQRRIADPELRRVVVHAAQAKLAEDIPFVSLYYRHVIHAYREKAWANIIAMPGEGLFHEWLPFQAYPINKNNTVLTIAGNQEPNSLNPLTATTVWEWKLLRLMYDKLARVNHSFRPEPWAAEEITQINDTLIEVKLRDGMTFHDGIPVKAEDVKFTYDYMKNNDIGYFRSFLSPIKSVEINNNGYIQFHLHQAYAPFISNTLAQIPILPAHYWVNRKPDDIRNIPLIGSGPLIFNKWTKNEIISFSVYEDYFAIKDIKITGLDYKVFPDIKSILNTLVNNNIDITGVNLNPEDVDYLNDYDDVKVIAVPDIGFHFIGFNCFSLPFSQDVLRQAAALSIDLKFLKDELLKGYGDIGGHGQPISSGNPFWKNKNIPASEFNIEKAKQILKDAGYTWDQDNYLLFP